MPRRRSCFPRHGRDRLWRALPLASSLVSGEQYVLTVSISNKAGLDSDEVATPAFGIDESAPVVVDAARRSAITSTTATRSASNFYVGVYQSDVEGTRRGRASRMMRA